MALWSRSSAPGQPIYAGSDVVVVEGLSSGPSRLYASSLNQALARALDADVLLVGGWPAGAAAEGLDAAVASLAEQLAIAAGGYASGEQARVVGCVVHGLPAADPARPPSWPRCWPRAVCASSRGCRIAPS